MKWILVSGFAVMLGAIVATAGDSKLATALVCAGLAASVAGVFRFSEMEVAE